MSRMPVAGERYRHFKGGEYEIVTIALHTETNEQMVVYKACYAPFQCFVRPLDQFVSPVDKEKYPMAAAEYRFERINAPFKQSIQDEPNAPTKQSVTKESSVSMEQGVLNGPSNAPSEGFLAFLNAATYEDKIMILIKNKETYTRDMLETMAASLDFELPPGDINDGIEYIKKSLEVKDRLEGTHLR